MSIKEQLRNEGYNVDDMYLPEEIDCAFIGIAVNVWDDHRAIYDENLIPDGFQMKEDLPDEIRKPIFITLYKENEPLKDDVQRWFGSPEIDDAIIGDDGSRVVYTYDGCVNCYRDYYQQNGTEEDRQEILKDAKLNYYYRHKNEGIQLEDVTNDLLTVDDIADAEFEYYETMAVDWVEFNTMRDYSYRDLMPIIMQNVDYLLG